MSAINQVQGKDQTTGIVGLYDVADSVNVADVFSSSQAYTAGQIVINPNDALAYKFIANHAAGAWNSAHVERIKMANALATKANVDGSYEQMTVGNAEQLVSTVGIEDKVPYNFRTSGGANDIGDREVDKVIGGTVAWNQLTTNYTDMSSAATLNGVTYQWQGQVCTFSGLVESAYAYSGIWQKTNYSVILGHKYLCIYENKTSINDAVFKMVFAGGNVPYNEINNNTKSACIFPATNTGYLAIYMRAIQKTTTYTATVRLPMLYDLTQMFGSTIADYIYSLETSTPGAGVAYFRSLFPAPYYPYNAGELMHVQTSAHKMTGFNQWDEEWESGYITYQGALEDNTHYFRSKNYIPIFPSTVYFYKCPSDYSDYARFAFYDANKNFVSYVGTSNYLNHTFTTPSNAYFMKFTTGEKIGAGVTYRGDICINISWDGERDGEYEPYEAHTYPLDDVELRGIPKLDANNNLYYDGDTYEADGTVTRKYGIIDLGAQTWTHFGSNRASIILTNAAVPTSTSMKANIITSRGDYVQLPANGTLNTEGQYALVKIGANPQPTLLFYYTDTDPTGYLVYELATPTTEEADPYQETQICNDFGTEEFVDTRTVPIPVGHVSMYQANLRAKLEMAPDSPSDGDGDYIVRQTNGENSYVKLTLPMASDAQVKAGTDTSTLITPSKEAAAAFYGLAKAAGDATQASSSNAVGTYTSGAKTAIKTMLGVESGVTGVTVNGTSVVTNGVAAIPKASSSAFGVVNPDAKTNEMTQAVGVDSNGKLYTAPGSGGGSSDIYFVNFTYNSETKQITTTDTIANIWSQVATSGKQAIAKFTDDSWGWDDRIGHERIPLFTIWNTNNGWYNYFVEFVNTRWRIVGKHNWSTDVDSWKIEFFSQPIASESIAYYIEEETGVGEDIRQGDVFVWRGKLYVATQTIWSGDTITVGTNCEETTIANAFILKPEIPQEEGTYHLQVSVDDGGEATISWVADT